MGKQSLRERLEQRQKDLKNSSKGYKMFKISEGTSRYRILFCGEDEDWALEVKVFYLGKDIGYVISPSTLGEKCAIAKEHKKLTGEDSSAEDREFAKKYLRPGRKFVVPAVRYKDEDGKELETESGAKLLMLAPSTYDAALELWLDKENGDFTLPLEGYDLKFKRTGKGKNDTEYKVVPCKQSKAPKGFRGPYNVEEMLKEIMPSYKETKELLEKYLSLDLDSGSDDEEEEQSSKKKKKKNKDL